MRVLIPLPEAGQAAERIFAEALERARRAPQGRALLVLHLSQLAPSGHRPHHARAARALLDDRARRDGGQVFVLADGDMALICRRAGLAEGLPAILLRLFRAELADPAGLLSLWDLETADATLVGWIEARAGGRRAPPPSSPERSPVADIVADRLRAILEGTAIADLMQTQTAALIVPGRGGLRPLFRELALALPVLEARLATSGIPGADPLLLRHLAPLLEARLLDLLVREPEAVPAGTGLHLNLSLAGILSDGFAEFARHRAAAAIEVSLIEACADPAAFAAARERVRAAGMRLVLDELGHLGMLLAAPGPLGADLVKLDWSPRLAALPAAERSALAEAVARLGAGRIVLQRAGTEQAVAWGLQLGIRRFQGRQVDAMLAAGRIATCAHAASCGLASCLARAASISPVTRRFCRDRRLLDGLAAPSLVAA